MRQKRLGSWKYIMAAIELSQKDKIESLRKQYGHETASHAFASLFAWQKDMGLSLFLSEELFAVKSKWKGKNAWFFPCGSESAKRNFITEHINEPHFRLCYMRQEDVDFSETFFKRKFRFTENLCDHEYLYDRKEQIDLAGKRFSSMRKSCAQVMRVHKLDYEILSVQRLSSVMEVIDVWAQKVHQNGEGGLQDSFATKSLLNAANELDILGILVYVDGVAFAIYGGYGLSEHVFDLSIAKQKDNLPGLSVFGRRELLRSLPPQYIYVNGEEDLGLEGLRTLKQLMRPVKIELMFEGEVNIHE